MKILLKIFILAGACVALVASVSAQLTIVYNDFNNGDAAGFVDRNTLGPLPAPSGQESSLTAVAGGSSVEIVRGSGTPTGMRGYVGAEFNGNIGYQGVEFNIQFDFKQDSGVNSEIYIYDAFLTTGAHIRFVNSLDANKLYVQTGLPDNFVSTGVTLTLGQWYHFDMTVVPENNAGEDTFILVVSDGTTELLNATYPFRNDLTSFNSVAWRNLGTSATDSFSVDNVRLSVAAATVPVDIDVTGGDVNVYFDTIPDATYRLQANGGLKAKDWFELGGVSLVGDGNPQSLSDLGAMTTPGSRNFYRVIED